MSEGVGIEAASDRVAEHFTRAMRAATSPLGMLTDPPVVCAAEAVVVLASVVLYNLNVIDRAGLPIIYAAIAVPIAGAVGVNFSLRTAREGVVSWLAGLPFPVENMNGLLNGVAQHLVVRFSADTPTREALTDMLDEIHTDCFALDFHEVEPEVELVIGVPDSKLNPASAAYRRYQRVQQMIDRVLVPVSAEHPIDWVRVA
jgi:hypothetical protein